MLISNIGVLLDWPAAYTPNTGAMDSFILVQLKEGNRGVFDKGAIQARSQNTLPKIKIRCLNINHQATGQP